MSVNMNVTVPDGSDRRRIIPHPPFLPQRMAIVPALGGGTYCIDSTEVTYGDYIQFYNANPPTAPRMP